VLKSRHIFRAVPLCALLLAGCVPFAGFPEFKNYHGDGEPKDRSFLLYGKPIYSYEVRFPEFDSTKPFSAEYAVGELPRLPAAKPMLYFVLARASVADAAHSQAWTQRIQYPRDLFADASVEVDIRDSHGATVIHFATKLTEMMWTFGIPTTNEAAGWWRDFIKTQGVALLPGEHYKLRVRYTPGLMTMTGKGYLMLSCGGI